MSYKYICIPKSMLSEEWLTDNNFNPDDDIDTFITYSIYTFITYSVASGIYDHYNFVGTTHENFICNTQKEFEQMVAQARLEKIL